MADGPSISVKLNNPDFKRRLDFLIRQIENPQALMDNIGEYMVRSTKNRILRQKVAPDGTPWAPLKQSTIDRKGHDSILFETGDLARSIHVQQVARTSVTIAADTEYAAWMQDGFRARGKTPVPARPFMGVSNANNRRIVSMIRDYLESGS